MAPRKSIVQSLYIILLYSTLFFALISSTTTRYCIKDGWHVAEFISGVFTLKIRLRYYLTVTFLEVKLSSILQRKVLSYYPNKQVRVCCDTYKNASVIYFRDTLLVYNT